MNIPYVSLTLARRYVTEIVRSPRDTVSLASDARPASSATNNAVPINQMTVRQQPATHA